MSDLDILTVFQEMELATPEERQRILRLAAAEPPDDSRLPDYHLYLTCTTESRPKPNAELEPAAR